MKDRIRMLWALRRLKRKRPEITWKFICTEDGCTNEVRPLRFLTWGCECFYHEIMRRFG